MAAMATRENQMDIMLMINSLNVRQPKAQETIRSLLNGF
jgi:hypothetical protein